MRGRTNRAVCSSRVELSKPESLKPEMVRDENEKPLRPSQCRAFMRKTLASEFRGIVDGFVKEAKSGSCQHVKLATELLEPEKRGKQSRKATATLNGWLKEVRRGD